MTILLQLIATIITGVCAVANPNVFTGICFGGCFSFLIVAILERNRKE